LIRRDRKHAARVCTCPPRNASVAELSAHEPSRLVSQTVLELGFWSWRLQASSQSVCEVPDKTILVGAVRCTGAIQCRIFEYVLSGMSARIRTLIFGRDKAKCPKCQKRKVESQLSVLPSPRKARPGAASPTVGCGSCGDPRGPGACSSEIWTNRQKLAQN